jgi:glycosyltransferase 2 family protein
MADVELPSDALELPPGEVSRGDREPRALHLHILRIVPLVVVLGLLVHFLLPRLDTIEDSLETMRTMSPWVIGLALAAEALSYLSNGFLLRSVVCLMGERISLRRAAAIEMGAGSVALVAAGALGFGAAIYKWTRHGGVSRDTAMLASWLPSVFDGTTLIVFALISAVELLLVHRLSRATVIALVLVVSILASLIGGVIVLLARNDWMTAIAGRAARLLKRIRPSADDSVLTDVAERAASIWRTMQRGGWIKPACSSLLVLTFDVTCLKFAFVAAGQPIPISILLAGYGVPLLLGRASLLPGGIAVVEVAMSALFGGLGIPANVAVVAVLTYRLISFWLPALVGIPMAIALQSRKRKEDAAIIE